jgi:hypothetical protein
VSSQNSGSKFDCHDRDGAVEGRRPDIGGELERDQPLRSIVAPGFPPTGAAGSVVEPFVGS